MADAAPVPPPPPTISRTKGRPVHFSNGEKWTYLRPLLDGEGKKIRDAFWMVRKTTAELADVSFSTIPDGETYHFEVNHIRTSIGAASKNKDFISSIMDKCWEKIEDVDVVGDVGVESGSKD